MILLEIFLAYIFIVFVLLRLVVPRLGFIKASLPEQIPDSIRAVVDKLNAEVADDADFL